MAWPEVASAQPSAGAGGGGGLKSVSATNPHEVWGALVAAMTTQRSVEHWMEWSVSGNVAAEVVTGQRQRSWVDAAQNYFIDFSRQTSVAGTLRSGCKDGRTLSYVQERNAWFSAAKACDPAGAVAGGLISGGHVGDGIVPPAMTRDEATRWVATVNGMPGFLTPTVERVTAQGRDYLRLTLDLKLSGEPRDVTGWLVAARKMVDPDYMMKPILAENFETNDSTSPVRAVYWVDPATYLPAYAEVVTTVVKRGGEGTPTGAVRLRRTEFHFDGPAPGADLNRAEPLPTLTWPRMGTQPPAVG